MGKGAETAPAPNLSGARRTGEDRGRGPLVLCLCRSLSRSSPVPDQSTFADRHIGPDGQAVAAMLAVIGVDSLDELAAKAVPTGILDKLTDGGAAPGLDRLPPAASEAEALAELRALADANTVAVSMIGQGYYDTLTPPVLLRNIMENPAWYTAYTPYQPEISQGRLEALLNFQTMVADLTGLEIANASMLDEGTAAAEAMTLMHRAAHAARHANRLAVDADVFAQTAAVLATRAKPLGIEIVTADLRDGLPDGEFFGVIAQLPGASGRITDWSASGGAGARPRRAGRRRRRPAGADADHTARRDRRRRRVRHHPKIRCANGIRRPARRLPGACTPSTPGSCRAGWSACHVDADGSPAYRLGAADPRAAHPPRQGDQQHLHRAGAAGGDGRDVRQLPRRRRADRDRAPRARPRRDDRRRAGRCAGARQVLRHRAGPGARARRRGAGRGQGQGHQPVARRRRPRVGGLRRGHHRRPRRRGAGRLRCVGRRQHRVGRPPRTSADPHLGVPDPSRVHAIPHRDGDDALPAHAGGQGYCLGPQHDSARLVHDEAQRRRRDGIDHLAGIRPSASVRAGIRHPGTAQAHRRPGELAGADHRLRRRLAAAQRRLARRVRRPAGDPRLPRQPGRAAPRHLPDPVQRARHQRRVGRAGRAAGGRGGLPRQRRRRPRRPAGQGGRACRPAGGADDHLPVHARRVRARHRRDLRGRARRRRPGLHRRRQPQRAGRPGPAGQVRRRRQPPEPAQDVLHPARRRRSGRRSGGGALAPGAVPARVTRMRPGAAARATGVVGALRVGLDSADHLGLHPDDGRRRACGRPR